MKVAERKETLAFVKAKKEVEGKLRNLPVIEKEAQELWENEVVVNISNDMHSKNKGMQSLTPQRVRTSIEL